MARRRPDGYVKKEQVLDVIEKSIESAIDWDDRTKGAFGDLESKLKRLHELQDIIIELSWRYGEENVRYMFTQKKNILNATNIDSVDSKYWSNRILVEESMTDISKVFIRF